MGTRLCFKPDPRSNPNPNPSAVSNPNPNRWWGRIFLGVLHGCVLAWNLVSPASPRGGVGLLIKAQLEKGERKSQGSDQGSDEGLDEGSDEGSNEGSNAGSYYGYSGCSYGSDKDQVNLGGGGTQIWSFLIMTLL